MQISERLLPLLFISAVTVSCGETPNTGPFSGDPTPGDSRSDAMSGDSQSDAMSGDSQSDAMSGDTSTGLCAQPTAVIDVTVAQLNQSIIDNETLAVVDVRESAEHAAGVIAGALLYPWNGGVLIADHSNLPSDRPLYVICASGGRSSAATTWLVNAGHTCVHNVLGGMNAWNAAGYPTTSP